MSLLPTNVPAQTIHIVPLTTHGLAIATNNVYAKIFLTIYEKQYLGKRGYVF